MKKRKPPDAWAAFSWTEVMIAGTDIGKRLRLSPWWLTMSDLDFLAGTAGVLVGAIAQLHCVAV